MPQKLTAWFKVGPATRLCGAAAALDATVPDPVSNQAGIYRFDAMRRSIAPTAAAAASVSAAPRRQPPYPPRLGLGNARLGFVDREPPAFVLFLVQSWIAASA